MLYNGDRESQFNTRNGRSLTGILLLFFFPLMRFSKKTPDKTACDIGKYLTANFLN
jgi:hypothetical protein